MNKISKVSVIIPCRNEENYIEKCIKGFLSQDYQNFEVILVDGISNDNTVNIIKKYAANDTRIKLVINKAKITPVAFNEGINVSSGDIITIFSAHSYPDPDYISKGVKTLIETNADCVGGNMRANAQNYTGKAICAATSHFFGVGNSRFHYYKKQCEVDTVYQGFYWKNIFEEAGLFDEKLIRDQDDEFNYRLKSLGKKIILNPEIISTYYSRSSLKKLFKQYFQYGLYKILVVQKHPGQARLRHFIPAIFVSVLIIALIGFISGLVTKINYFFLPIFVIILYFILNIIFSLQVSLKSKFRLFFILPCVFFTLHFAYGIGFIIGCFVFRKRNINETHF